MRQVRACRKADEDEADILAILFSYGCTREEAEGFFDTAPAGDVARVVQAIFVASGLLEGAQKSE